MTEYHSHIQPAILAEPLLDYKQRQTYDLIMRYLGNADSWDTIKDNKILNMKLTNLDSNSQNPEQARDNSQIIGRLLYEGAKTNNKLIIACVQIFCKNTNKVQLPIHRNRKELDIPILSLLRLDCKYVDKNGEITETYKWNNSDFAELDAIKEKISPEYATLKNNIERMRSATFKNNSRTPNYRSR